MGRRRRPYDPSKRNGRNGHTNGHAHDRRAFYRLPANSDFVAVQIPDPYGVSSDAEAQRAPGLRSDGTEAPGEEWRAPEPPRLVVVHNLRGDQIARMQARRQISYAQFEAGRHYQSLHEIAFARALHSLDVAAPVIDKNRYGVEPFSDQQRAAIHRLRVIDGSIVLRHGIDTLALVHAVLLGGRSVVQGQGVLLAHGLPPGARRNRGARRSRDQAGAPSGARAICLAGGGDGRDGPEGRILSPGGMYAQQADARHAAIRDRGGRGVEQVSAAFEEEIGRWTRVPARIALHDIARRDDSA